MAWTKEQINFLIDNESIKTYAEIAYRLGKSVNAVQLKGLDLGIIKTRIQKPMRQKRCPKCLETKKIEAFYVYRSKSRNTKRIGNYCKTCSRKPINNHAAKAFKNIAEKHIATTKTIEEKCAKFLNINIKELSKLPGIVESFRRNCVIRKKIQI